VSEIKVNIENLKEDKNILKAIVEMLICFGDVDKNYEGVDVNMGNIYCPFHQAEGLGKNEKSPCAKVYYNDKKDINTIYCFNSRKRYTVYDFIELVEQKDPYTFLIENRNISDILPLYESILKGHIKINDDIQERKIMYVDNLFIECQQDTVEYIERLYTGEKDV